jgi:hypothetical protein
MSHKIHKNANARQQAYRARKKPVEIADNQNRLFG